MISVAAELAEMHPQTLRMYEARGLIEPSRSPKGTRLYSQADVERLRRIQQMTAELGLNLAGVERVLALEAELDAAQRAARARWRARPSRRAPSCEQELDRLRRSMSADIVRYSGARRRSCAPPTRARRSPGRDGAHARAEQLPRRTSVRRPVGAPGKVQLPRVDERVARGERSRRIVV